MANSDSMERRLDWLSRQKRYEDGSRQATQKCEDLVARRILSGLGYTERGLAGLEESLGIPYDGSKPLMDRTRTVLDIVSNDMFSSDPSKPRFGLFCRNGDKRHGVVLDDLDGTVGSASMFSLGAIVLARVGDFKLAWAYVIIPDGEIPPWVLQPPAVLLAKHNGYSIWYREVSDLFRDMSSLCRWDMA